MKTKPQTYEGMQANSPLLSIGRPSLDRKVTNRTSIPNWNLINREHLSDEEFTQRWLMLGSVYHQMVTSERHRRLIPLIDWEGICQYAILKAICTWKGNDKSTGDPRCPIKNYSWAILHWTSVQYWKLNKHSILDRLELDAHPDFELDSALLEPDPLDQIELGGEGGEQD